jgi:hypothetical protein
MCKPIMFSYPAGLLQIRAAKRAETRLDWASAHSLESRRIAAAQGRRSEVMHELVSRPAPLRGKQATISDHAHITAARKADVLWNNVLRPRAEAAVSAP